MLQAVGLTGAITIGALVFGLVLAAVIIGYRKTARLACRPRGGRPDAVAGTHADGKAVNASSTSVRTPTPVGPFGMNGLFSSAQAVPAMSMWIHGRPARELSEEQRGGNRAAHAAAGVQHVGDLASQLILVFLEQRQRPASIAGAFGDASAHARRMPAAFRTGRW